MNILCTISFCCLVVSIATLSSAQQNSQYSNWPTCLADICFDSKFTDESYLIKQYGQGYKSSFDEETIHCYQDKEQGVFVKVAVHNDIPPFIDEIFVSKSKLCKKYSQPQKPFKSFNTKEGLQIGDTQEKAEKVYGKPIKSYKNKVLRHLIQQYFDKSLPSNFADLAIEYGPNRNDDLLRCMFFLKSGVITAIVLSASE